MAVKEKWLQGRGLGPVVGGEDHLPVEGEVTHVHLLLKCTTKLLHSKPLACTAMLICRKATKLWLKHVLY